MRISAARRSGLVLLICAAVAFLSGCGKSEPARPAPAPSRKPPAGGAAPTGTTTTSVEPVKEGWGDVSGSFVYVGTPPVPEKLKVDKDVEVCTQHHPVNESLVVGSDGQLANVVLFVRTKGIKIHPDYQATAGDRVVLDNHYCRFEPHVQLLRTSQTLVLKNSDPMGHNTKGDLLANPSFNFIIAAGAERSVPLSKTEKLPAAVGCNIHTWMTAWLVVRDDPYMAVSDKDGMISIKNLPSGQHEFQFWQEKVGYLDGIRVGGQVTKKGRVKLTVQPGANDLGKIEVDESLFRK